MEAGHPLAEKYAKNLQKFHDVQSCLLKSERNKMQPDLIGFDRDQLKNKENAEVCIFRIATSYRSPEEMRKWVEIQEFVTKIRENILLSKRSIADGHILLKQHWPKVSPNILCPNNKYPL